jgi:hypothetical protein
MGGPGITIVGRDISHLERVLFIKKDSDYTVVPIAIALKSRHRAFRED